MEGRFEEANTLTYRPCWRGCGCGYLMTEFAEVQHSQGWLEHTIRALGKLAGNPALWDGETHFLIFAYRWQNMFCA